MTHHRPTLFQSPHCIVYTPDAEGNICTVNAGHHLCRDLALALQEVREKHCELIEAGLKVAIELKLSQGKFQPGCGEADEDLRRLNDAVGEFLRLVEGQENQAPKKTTAPPLNWTHQTFDWSTATNKFARVLIHYSPTLADNTPWWWRLKTINVVESGKCETAEEAMMEAGKCWERIWLKVATAEELKQAIEEMGR